MDRFIEHLFYYEGYYAGHSMDKFLPDGSMDLLIDLTDAPKKLFHNEEGTLYTTYKRSWISGMKTEYILIDASVTSMAGVHFKPGGAFPFFNFPLSELKNKTIELDDLWDHQIHSVRDAILNTAAIENKFSVLEDFCLKKIRKNYEPHVLLTYAIDQLQQSPQLWTIEKLSGKAGITPKHLINLFKVHVGLSPRQFARIVKFQKLVKLVEQQRSIEWAPLAYECGYYDQSHFIKEFRSFSGINPSVYLSQRGEYMNYLPVL